MSWGSAEIFNSIAYLLSGNYKVIEDTLKEELVPFSSARSVLDIGCGTGRFAEVLPSSSYRGIDLKESYISFAKKKHSGDFKKMDARHMEFSSGEFDVAFSVGLFHHMCNEDVDAVLREASRVLTEGGVYLVIDAVWPTSLLNLPGYVLRKMDQGKFVRTKDEYDELFRKRFLVENSYMRKYGVLEVAFFLMVGK